MVTVSGRDSWASGLISTPLAILYVLFILKAVQKSPKQSIIQIVKKKSPALGNLAGLVLVFFFVLVAYVMLRDFESAMELFMERTPLAVFGLIIMLLGSYAVKQGLEVMARVAAILLLPNLLIIVIVLTANFFSIDSVPALIPLESWNKTVRGVVHQSANFGELLVLTMVLPLTRRNRNTVMHLALPVIFTGLLITVLTLILYATFGKLAVHFTYKFYELYRNVGRYDSLFIVLWMSTFFIKVPVFLYAAVKGLGEVLELKRHDSLILPMAIIIASLSLTEFKGYTDYTEFFLTSFPLFRLIVEIGIPLLLLAVFSLNSAGAKDG